MIIEHDNQQSSCLFQFASPDQINPGTLKKNRGIKIRGEMMKNCMSLAMYQVTPMHLKKDISFQNEQIIDSTLYSNTYTSIICNCTNMPEVVDISNVRPPVVAAPLCLNWMGELCVGEKLVQQGGMVKYQEEIYSWQPKIKDQIIWSYHHLFHFFRASAEFVFCFDQLKRVG